MSNAASHIYTDVNGREYRTDRLDALLADDDVMLTVRAGASFGLDPKGTWSPGRVLKYAGLRYRRPEVVALLLLLVTRYFDTAGAHYLGRRAVA